MNLKKPKFWDYKKPNLISNLLLPISKIVETKSNYFKSKGEKIGNIKTICIGNIYLGGTGKTSFAIEIKKILDKLNIKSCFIKKEYSNQADEQKLLSKFGKLFINKSRLKALKNADSENYQIAILDDGLQDKSISYDLTFVCFNKKNFIGNGRIIPAGPLREPLVNLENYRNVVFSGNDEDNKNLEKILSQNQSNLNFYDSKYELLNSREFDLKRKFIVFSGIGNHQTFINMLKMNDVKIIYDLEFSDHYNYQKKDIEKILKLASENDAKILTTEKDYLRLNDKLKLGINYTKINLKISNTEQLKRKLIELI
tara:strand:+ start:359 stop:1294 length:936 start_codon:yes stop_codon:yes gene_type:complete